MWSATYRITSMLQPLYADYAEGKQVNRHTEYILRPVLSNAARTERLALFRIDRIRDTLVSMDVQLVFPTLHFPLIFRAFFFFCFFRIESQRNTWDIGPQLSARGGGLWGTWGPGRSLLN